MKTILHKRVSILAIISMASFTTIYGQLDTTGLSGWPQLYNSTLTWEEGAFGANALGHPDYGWGTYNAVTHAVTGDSLFVIRLQNSSVKQLWMVEKSGASVYTFRYADLDGGNEQEAVIDMKNHTDPLFVYYSLAGDSLYADLPAAESWDLVLTKYASPEFSGYFVTGFLANDGVSVSVFNAPDSATAANATLADTTVFTDSIAAIGDSWSMFTGSGMATRIVPVDTIAYFVRQANGMIHKLQATFFESGLSGMGRLGIRTQVMSPGKAAEVVHDTLVMGSQYAEEVFYSLDSGTVDKAARNAWDIGFRSGTFTSSIISNSTMGVELYAYPNGDTSAWYSTTAILPQMREEAEINLYPVPATDRLIITFGEETPAAETLRLYDMTGREVDTRIIAVPGGRHLQMDVSHLRAGIYLLEFRKRSERTVRRFSIR